MKPYLLSLAAGAFVGLIYAVSGIRSPAPPVVALIGLLGMLGGEQLPALGHKLLAALAAPAQSNPPGDDEPR